jgi:uncharacterized protein (DUF2141 family)
MKQLFILLLIIPVLAWHKPDSHQVLHVSNMEGIKGKLYIGWYRSAAEFRQPDKAVLQKIVEVEGKETIDIPFDNVPSGTYAIAVFLDKNGNGKIDTNMFGIPKEKYGFSNNKYPLTRAATFDESKFQVAEKEQTISIRLKG